MVQLSEKHPDMYAEFLKGNFVVQKSLHKFSLIGKDQSHEQSNKSLHAHGGAVGLYDNPEALTLFMLTDKMFCPLISDKCDGKCDVDNDCDDNDECFKDTECDDDGVCDGICPRKCLKDDRK